MAEGKNDNLDSNRDLDIKVLKSKLRQIQEEHKKLIAVATELTSALQLNILGQTRNLQTVLDHCSAIYPSLFIPQEDVHQKKKSTLDNTSPNTNEDIGELHLQCSEVSEAKSKDQPNYDSVSQMDSLKLEGLKDGEDLDRKPVTPITEREIRDILEIALTEAVRFLTQSDNSEPSDCCELGNGKACDACRKDIFQIVESILIKVMESPRFKTSNCNSTINTTRIWPEVTQYHVQIPKEHLNRTVVDELSSKPHQSNDEKIILGQKTIKNDLDYDLIKGRLLKENSEKRVCILRALRRDLSKSGRKQASKTLERYIRHDIFNIQEQCLLPEKLLRSDSSLVNEQFLRLLNTTASFRRGREYLSSNDKLLRSILVPKLMNESTPLAKDMLIATLQKLSLQKHTRPQMIEEGFLDYLILYLAESYQKISLYNLEHSIALLMNLCSEDEARYYCVHNKEKVVQLLKTLLDNPHTSCIPYINGVLLSILTNEKVKAEAKKRNLDKVIHELAQGINTKYLQKQLEFIIQVRFGQQLQYFIGDDDEFPEKEDVLENELDSDSELVCGEEDDKKQTDNLFRVCNFEVDSISKRSEPLTSVRGKKKIMHRTNYFPKIPFCYIDICQDVHDGSKTCRCLKCMPGKNRYSCGCYEVICKEIAEEIDNIFKGQTTNRAKYVKNTFGSSNARQSLKKISGTQCAICGDKVCDCAFESRPKIHRTPPKT